MGLGKAEHPGSGNVKSDKVAYVMSVRTLGTGRDRVSPSHHDLPPPTKLYLPKVSHCPQIVVPYGDQMIKHVSQWGDIYIQTITHGELSQCPSLSEHPQESTGRICPRLTVNSKRSQTNLYLCSLSSDKHLPKLHLRAHDIPKHSGAPLNKSLHKTSPGRVQDTAVWVC